VANAHLQRGPIFDLLGDMSTDPPRYLVGRIKAHLGNRRVVLDDRINLIYVYKRIAQRALSVAALTMSTETP
jgi:hypothetical protein